MVVVNCGPLGVHGKVSDQNLCCMLTRDGREKWKGRVVGQGGRGGLDSGGRWHWWVGGSGGFGREE